MTCQLFSALLITGGHGAKKSTEIFLPSNNTGCSLLPELPEGRLGQSQDNELVCGGGDGDNRNTTRSCDRWTNGSWTRTTIRLRESRRNHVSWSTERGIYLIGGSYSKRTSELVGWDGKVKDGFVVAFDTE